MKKKASLFSLLAVVICQLAFAQSSTSNSGSTDSVTTNFVTNATIANMKEIATGKMAEKKASDPSVKAYGTQMVNEHTMATKQMMAIVKSKHIKATKPSGDMVATDSSLVNSSGAQFDKMYVTMMIMDHKNTIALFEKASTDVSDPDLKAFATKALPMLRHHLTEIQGIASKMNITASE